jgi:DNA invertase Pin-like site-specific DNA recombinase
MIKTKCYGYLRVSGRGQVKGHGFSRQLESINTYAKAHGYDVSGLYKDKGISGTNDETNRPQFTEMIEDILSNGVRTVIVEDLSRLAREYRIQEQLLVYLASKNIVLINANTAENVTQAINDDPMKKAMIQIQGVFGELDKSLLVRKLRKAREAVKKATGKCEGIKRYGEDNAEEQAIIKRIRYMRRLPRGLNKSRMTYQAICNQLNAEGFTTQRGKPWVPAQVWNILNRSYQGKLN